MEQAFELYVKITEGGEKAQVDTRLEGMGHVSPEMLVNVLSELVPVVLRKDREYIVKLCWKLATGMQPEKSKQESVSTDLPDIGPEE